jgi:PIN domain nuclease of toxin-antitoxin system
LSSLLLDTHVLLWWWTNDRRLSKRARAAITDERNAIYVSAASAWEIATKQRLGRLNELPGVTERFVELVAADSFKALPITFAHALRAGQFGSIHRDPFDRMLAAQSDLERYALVTADDAIAALGCKTFW